LHLRKSNKKKIGIGSDFIDNQARSKPSFVEGHSTTLVEAEQSGGSSPAFGLKPGFGAKVSEMMMFQKKFLPVNENQERSTLQRVSHSLEDLGLSRRRLRSSSGRIR
jgi:hypothetical protein